LRFARGAWSTFVILRVLRAFVVEKGIAPDGSKLTVEIA
jgi:hypothetical protein